MGWLALAAIGVAAFAALRLTGVSRALGAMAGAALMLGAAGYAWQQRAGLPGHPVRATDEGVDVDPGMAEFRQAILPATPAAQAALAAADAQLQAGDPEAAVRGLIEAVRRSPRDPALWAGVGGALCAHDGGQVSPAAQLAFRRAVRLAPQAPGPPFFLGLALVQSGDLAAAKTAWLRALILTPPGAPARLDLAERLALLDQFQAQAPPMPDGR